MLRAIGREGDAFSTSLNSRVAKDRLERFSIRPCRRIDGLAVVMRVEDHRTFRFRRQQLAENDRAASGNGQ